MIFGVSAAVSGVCSTPFFSLFMYVELFDKNESTNLGCSSTRVSGTLRVTGQESEINTSCPSVHRSLCNTTLSHRKESTCSEWHRARHPQKGSAATQCYPMRELHTCPVGPMDATVSYHTGARPPIGLQTEQSPVV